MLLVSGCAVDHGDHSSAVDAVESLQGVGRRVRGRGRRVGNLAFDVGHGTHSLSPLILQTTVNFSGES